MTYDQLIVERLAIFEAQELAEERGANGDPARLEQLAAEVMARVGSSDNWQSFGRSVAAYLRRAALRARNLGD